MPEELYNTLNEVSDGISENDAESIKQRIIKAINNTNILKILENEEKKELIGLIVDIIVDALKSGKKLND